MSYADPSLQLQKAIVAALKADPGVSAIINGRIYDAVPGGAAKPYVSFGPFQLLPEHGDCLDGGEAIVTLDGWAAGPDTVQIKQLGTAIARALDLAELTLDEPQRLVEMTIEQTQYMRDPDGLTAHAVITVHTWTEPTGEDLEPTGGLAASEARDDATFTALVGRSGAMAATEARDDATFAGIVLSARTGTLAASEARDTASFEGAGALATRTGTLAATEAADTVAMAGTVAAAGGIAAPTLDLVASSDTGASSTDNITDDTTPDLMITFGTPLVEGDVITFQDDNNSDFSSLRTDIAHTVTAMDALIGTITLTISEYFGGTWYLRAKHTRGVDVSPWSATLTLQILDTLSPTLSAPTGVATGQTTATLTVNTNEANGTLYAVHSASAPTAAQIKLGQNSTGAASAYAFNQPVTASGVQTKNATGLTAATSYTMHFMQEDNVGNQSNVASAVTFATDGTAISWGTTNGVDKHANLTLSGANLTVSIGVNTFFANIRGSAGRSSGKYFYSVLINALGADGQGLGIGSSSFDTTSRLYDAPWSAAWNNSGHTAVGGGGVGIIQAWTTGSRCDIAADLTAKLIWFRLNGGLWNNSGTADPATGTGGINFAAATGAAPWFPVVTLEINGDNYTANFGGTAYTHAPPAGFGNW